MLHKIPVLDETIVEMYPECEMNMFSNITTCDENLPYRCYLELQGQPKKIQLQKNYTNICFIQKSGNGKKEQGVNINWGTLLCLEVQ